MASADTIVPPAMTADIVQAGEPGVPPVPTAIDPTTSAIASPALSIAPTLAEYPESVNEEVKPAPSSPEKSPTRSPHVGASPSLSRVPTLAEHSGYNGTTTLPASHAKTAASARPEEPGLTDQTNFLPMRQVIYIFCGLSLGLGCTFLDQTIVATALPRISSDLHAGKESSWVATAYLLTSLAFTPLVGRWSDIFGRKQIYVFSVLTFLFSSLACALAKTMIQLIIFRAFQGIGGGGIITMTFVIIADIVSLQDRGKYQGIIEAVSAITNGLGPLLGGVFSQYTTWRWAFWINIPMATLALIVPMIVLPNKRVQGNMREKLLRVDYAGSLLTIASSILVLIGLNWGGVTYPWSSAAVLAPLLIGIALFAVFLFWEARYPAFPIMPLRVFRNRTVVGTLICTCMNGVTFFIVMYYMPQFLQLVHGMSPVASSVLLVPFLAPMGFFVFLTGQITARTGHYKYIIVAGYAGWTIAQGLLSMVRKDATRAQIIGPLFMAGVFSAFTYQTSLIAAHAAVPRNEMAVVTGVRNFVRLIGSTLAIAIAGTVVGNALRTGMRPLGLTAAQEAALLNDPTTINGGTLGLTAAQREAVIDAYARGFTACFYITIGCMAVAFVASVVLIGQHPLTRADDAERKAQGREEVRRKRASVSGERDVEKGAETPANEKAVSEEGGAVRAS